MKISFFLVFVVLLLVNKVYPKGLVNYGGDNTDANALQHQHAFHKYQYGDPKYGNEYYEVYDNVMNKAPNTAFQAVEIGGGLPNPRDEVTTPFPQRTEAQQLEKPVQSPKPASRTSFNRFLSKTSQTVRHSTPDQPSHEDGMPLPFDKDRLQSNAKINHGSVEKVKSNFTEANTQDNFPRRLFRGKRNDGDAEKERNSEREQKEVYTPDVIDKYPKMEAVTELIPTTDEEPLRKTTLSSSSEVQIKTTNDWSDNKEVLQDSFEGSETVRTPSHERGANIHQLNPNLPGDFNASSQSDYADGTPNVEMEPDSNHVGEGGTAWYDGTENKIRREEEELKKYVIRTVSYYNTQKQECSLEKLEKLLADLSKFRQDLLRTALLNSGKRSRVNGYVEKIIRPMLNYMIGTVIRNLLFILDADSSSVESNSELDENSSNNDSLIEIEEEGPIESTVEIQINDQIPSYLRQSVQQYLRHFSLENSYNRQESSQNPKTRDDSQWRPTAYEDGNKNESNNQIFGDNLNRMTGAIWEKNQIEDDLEASVTFPYLMDSPKKNRLSEIDPLKISVEQSGGYPVRSNRRRKLEAGSNDFK